MAFLFSCKKEKTIDAITCTDIDGNVYKTVTIGTQIWMAENLKTSRYNDGSPIATGMSNDTWKNTTKGAYAICNDNAANENATYGKLYNFYAVQTNKLAPAGWHVATRAEWTTLITFLGGEDIAGNKMKSTSNLWKPYTDVVNTNSSGFSALPGGYRDCDNGKYEDKGESSYWWHSTEYSVNSAFSSRVYYFENNFFETNYSKGCGFSVRCIKD